MREAQFLGQRAVLISLGVGEEHATEIHSCTSSGLEMTRIDFPDEPRDQSPARCGRTSRANISSERRDLAGSIPGIGVAMMKCVQAYWRLNALNFAIHSAGVPTIMCSAYGDVRKSSGRRSSHTVLSPGASLTSPSHCAYSPIM